MKKFAIRSAPRMGVKAAMAVGFLCAASFGLDENNLPAIEKLDGKVAYEKGQLSLVLPDAVSGFGDQVLLVNATDKPVAGMVYEFTGIILEAKFGDIWRRCEPQSPGCGTVPPPRPLPPGRFLPFQRSKPGDVEGELRYCLLMGMTPVLATPAFRGDYSSQEFAQARSDVFSYQGIRPDVLIGLNQGRWKECFTASDRNELLGALELERAYDECFSTRKALQEWLDFKASISKSEEDRKFAEKAKLILAAPWEHVLDEESKLRRCLEALEDRKKEYGSPSSSRAMIWRYLNVGDKPLYGVTYRTIEQHKILEDLRTKTGNPLGASGEQWMILKREIARSLSSENSAEKQAAKALQAQPWWPKD